MSFTNEIIYLTRHGFSCGQHDLTEYHFFFFFASGLTPLSTIFQLYRGGVNQLVGSLSTLRRRHPLFEICFQFVIDFIFSNL
jgi:hypothetical protein